MLGEISHLSTQRRKMSADPARSSTLHCVQKKNTHSHFLPYLWVMHRFKQKICSEYTQGTADSYHVEIRYSLQPMTSLWRHICKQGSSHRTQPIHNIIQRLIINNNQQFNVRQHEYYTVLLMNLKCRNLCSKYPPFSLTQVWICMSHPRQSVAVTLSRVSGDRT